MASTTKNGLGATRMVHPMRYAGEAEGEMVSPPAFLRQRHLEIASSDGAHSIVFNSSIETSLISISIGVAHGYSCRCRSWRGPSGAHAAFGALSIPIRREQRCDLISVQDSCDSFYRVPRICQGGTSAC